MNSLSLFGWLSVQHNQFRFHNENSRNSNHLSFSFDIHLIFGFSNASLKFPWRRDQWNKVICNKKQISSDIFGAELVRVCEWVRATDARTWGSNLLECITMIFKGNNFFSSPLFIPRILRLKTLPSFTVFDEHKLERKSHLCEPISSAVNRCENFISG